MGLADWFRDLLGRRVERVAQPLGTTPARLLVMRHAEKTGDKRDMSLSPAGAARAAKLAVYIPQTFGRPDFLVAAMKSKHSNRSYETLVPLSQATGVAIDTGYRDTDARDLAEALMRGGAYAGKFGVISWHQNALPDLIRALGAPSGTYPADWDEDVFNLIIDIDYRGGGAPAVRRVVEPF